MFIEAMKEKMALSRELINSVGTLMTSVNTLVSQLSKSSVPYTNENKSDAPAMTYKAVASAVSRSLAVDTEAREKSTRAVLIGVAERAIEEETRENDQLLVANIIRMANDPDLRSLATSSGELDISAIYLHRHTDSSYSEKRAGNRPRSVKIVIKSEALRF